jgi:transposase
VIGSTRVLQVLAYGQPADMRKGFDGLYGLVRTALGQDPLSGDLYLFVSRDRRRAKVLLWDGTGLCIYAKRLERGRFADVWSKGVSDVRLTMSELQLFLEGSKAVGRIALSPPKYCRNSSAGVLT